MLTFLLIFFSGITSEEPIIYPDRLTNLLQWREKTGLIRPVIEESQWQNRRNDILAGMQQVMGTWPGLKKRPKLNSNMTEEVDEVRFLRQRWLLEVEKDDWLPVYVLLPKHKPGKMPAMVCLHQTNRPLGKKAVVGLGDRPDQHYAKELAQLGYFCICPDYINMGEYKCDPYRMGYASATMKGIYNHSRCVDYLLSRGDVDEKRIGAIGHSLGGHNSIFLAAFDERIRCIITSCGFCSFDKYMKGDLTGWSHDGYMPRIRTQYGRDLKKMPFEFTEVIAAVAPRPFFTCSPTKDSNFDLTGVKQCIEAAKPVYKFLNAEGKVIAHYPDSEHLFHDQTRRMAYHWLAENMK